MATDEKPLVTQAMIQAAGLGTRLRPLTLDTPKPLLRVQGRALIDLAIETLARNGVQDIAINTHYLTDKFEAHLSQRSSPAIHISYEPALLDTGGGIKKAMTLLNPDLPVFCLSSDWYWEDEDASPWFGKMAEVWDDDKMDILQLLIPKNAMHLTTSSGDYDVRDDGRAVRALDKNGIYMWTSVRIFHPRIFNGTPDGPFSFLELLDKAEENGRLFALYMPETHAAPWHHISTLEDYRAVADALEPEKV